MAFFRIQDFETFDRSPTNPANLRARVDDMILSSTVCRVKIEAINPETGEYRLVLQGTLDRESARWGD